MTYTTVAEVQKISVYKDGTTDAGGKIAQAIALAELRIKSRIKKAGLTPPSVDDTLNGAEQLEARGILRRMKREEGSLPIGTGSPDTYDATNKAVDFDDKVAMQMVDEYIQYTTASALPYDTDGTTREDAVGTQFKLDQNSIGGFE